MICTENYKREWAKIDAGVIKKLIESMPRRVESIIDEKIKMQNISSFSTLIIFILLLLDKYL